MGAWAAEVIEDSLLGASGLLQGVGQDRQALEDLFIVDGLGQLWDFAVLPP
jgi:hypothetical protein